MRLTGKKGITARGAQRTRDEHKKLSMYSKQWLPGDTLRVFYPLIWENGQPDIVVGAVWGHSVSDIKTLDLKTAFIPSLCEFDEDMNPIGVPDITYQFSQIAKVFVDGQKAIEEQRIMDKNWPTEAARKEALEKVNAKFDAKNNMKAVKPIIGKLQYYITTEVGCVKEVNGVFNMESAAIVSAPLSNQTIDKLYAIMSDPKYAPGEGDNFLEVEWKYPMDADKAASARGASPAGLTSEYRMANVAPQMWEQMKGRLEGVSFDSDTIAKRATRKIEESKIRQALTRYVFFSSEYLDAANEEGIEVLCRHANVIHELDAERAFKNEEIIGKIKESLMKIGANQEEMPDTSNATGAPNLMNLMQNQATPAPEAPQPTQPTPAAAPVTPSAPVADSAQNQNVTTGTPSLASLMSDPNNLSSNSDMMSDIDLSMI